MARDRERHFRLPPDPALCIRDNQGACIEDCRKRRQPGLVSVLRAEVAQDRIGKVTLHQFRHPRLPVVEILTECLHVLPLDMSPQQFACCWRGTGVRIHPRDVHLPSRKGPVQYWQVGDDNRQEAKTDTALNYRDCPCCISPRCHIPQAKGKESGAAQVKIRPKVNSFVANVDV